MSDGSENELKIRVIDALRKASDPALQKCKMKIGSVTFKLGEVFRN